MIGHYQRKWSSSARWCERLAALCLPYFAIAIILHRTDQITTPQVYWLIAIGLIMVLASLLLGLRAFLDLWNLGRRGGKSTLRGMLVSAALLGPFLWYAYLGLTRPPLNDVSTNPFSPPLFAEANRIRAADASKGINQLAVYDVAYRQALADAYPRLASRRYNSGAERILGAARELFEKNGWRITSVRGQLHDAAEPADAGSAGDRAEKLAGELPDDIYIEAVARSRFFGFRQDVVLAIISEEESTLVDMRASTRWGAHDFGRNNTTITEFLSELDSALLGIAGEG